MLCHVAPGLISACGPGNADQLKAQARFFKRSPSGTVTISSSALLIEDGCDGAQVLAPLSLLWPFLVAESQQCARSYLQPPQATGLHVASSSKPSTAAVQAGSSCRFPLALVPGVQLQLTLQGHGHAGGHAGLTDVACTLEGGLVVPEAAAAMQQALADMRQSSAYGAAGSSGGDGGGWQFAWGLGQLSGGPPAAPSARAWISSKSSPSHSPPECLGAGFVVLRPQLPRTTLLEAQLNTKDSSKSHPACPVHHTHSASGQSQDAQHTGVTPSPGARVLAVGSPFGCLAPTHFHNLVMQGVVSHTLGQSHTTSTGTSSPVVLLDAPVLPGMEGGAVIIKSHSQQMQPQPATAGTEPGAGPGTCECRGASTGPAVVMQGLQGQHCLMGVLTLPLSRSRDGAQFASAVMWPHVYQALCRFNQSCQDGHLHQGPALPGLVGVAVGAAAIPGPLPMADSRKCTVLQPRSEPLQGTLALHPCRGISSSSSSSVWSTPAVQGAQQSVVMVRARSSWATGVLVTPAGHILTNAHLLLPSMSHQPAPVLTTSSVRAPVSTAVSSAHSLSSSSSSYASSSSRYPQYVGVRLYTGAGGPRWVRARILHIFRSHLDLAVLQVVAPQQEAAGGEAHRQPLQLTPLRLCVRSSQPGAPEPVQPARLKQNQPAAAAAGVTEGPDGSRVKQTHQRHKQQHSVYVGEEILVLGHGVFGPHVSWAAAPGITYGSVARVVHSGPQGSSPCMLITTAAVRSGASGGAVIDTQGCLVGLVTSNARHASGATLQHLNFCIPAEQLDPIITLLSKHAQLLGPGPQEEQGATERLVQQLVALDVHDPDAERVWALQPPASPKAPGVVTAQQLPRHSRL